ncbi:hypothetical protein [Serratia silvae]|uniref:Uncharacterized protein n=1 Tax=Serratia silvae TaxID=2824122 RepID=A0ABT0KBI1_9GAMM|nr:hypothetical protein [Serratia silvae]MCL1029385.1 hypothetical protein [Serratia silvae]
MGAIKCARLHVASVKTFYPEVFFKLVNFSGYKFIVPIAGWQENRELRSAVRFSACAPHTKRNLPGCSMAGLAVC